MKITTRYDPDVCHDPGCNRTVVTWRYNDKTDRVESVCRRHLRSYKVLGGTRWQVEDEAFGLRFARRSRSKYLAQWYLYLDQRAAMRGRTSLIQQYKTRKAARKS